eukprot:4173-Amphidinium_carterae.2
MPQNKDDRVQKEKKEKTRTAKRGSTGSELVTESDVGTPVRKDCGDPLIAFMDITHAEPCNSQNHGGTTCAAGVATVIPPPPMVVPPVCLEQRTLAPRTMADDEPLTKADLAAMQQGLALMMQKCSIGWHFRFSGLQRAQERQGARLSALEESQRSLADKVKRLEVNHAERAASVPPARSAIFAPCAPPVPDKDDRTAPHEDGGRRAASEHTRRSLPDTPEAIERRRRQCILLQWVSRNATRSPNSKLSFLPSRTRIGPQWPAQCMQPYQPVSCTASQRQGPAGIPKRMGEARLQQNAWIYCNRVLDKQASCMVREARRFLCAKDPALSTQLRVCRGLRACKRLIHQLESGFLCGA